MICLLNWLETIYLQSPNRDRQNPRLQAIGKSSYDGRMRDLKRGSHTIWDCKYHLVWVTKYRYPILTGDVGERARHLLREIARSHEMTIYAGAINRDHVHMLIAVPPHVSVSRAVQYLKGKSSHKMLNEFPALRKRYWGQHLWARGYWVASSGNVTDEVWKKYIEDQKPEEPDDNFKVV